MDSAWLVIIPFCLSMSVLLTDWAWRALNKPEPPTPPCDHPWYIDHRCMVCGEPK